MATDSGGARAGAAPDSGGEQRREAVWTHRDALPTASPLPGVAIRMLAGERLMAAWITLDPHAVVPAHEHPHEQLGMVLEGEMELTIGGDARPLGPGDAYAIPPEVRHEATAGPDGCLVLDLFAPPREDYLALAAGAAAT